MCDLKIFFPRLWIVFSLSETSKLFFLTDDTLVPQLKIFAYHKVTKTFFFYFSIH